MGPPVEPEVVRAMMLLRARTLAMGYSGVRPVVVDTIVALLNADITPAVHEHGSLGASGDLAPLAHVALALIGEGECAPALAAAGIEPVTLRAKEGLALINGTDGMLGMLVLALADLDVLVRAADITAAMSVEALLGTDRAFAEDLMALRPHAGQTASAANLRRLLADSPIVASHRTDDPRVQDAYSLRCTPQVHGAARDTVAHASGVADIELRSAIDNPTVLPDGRVESCGHFHGAPVAFACDFLAVATAEVGAIAERRTDRLLDQSRSQGLPPFLVEDAGVNSGLMLAQYTQAAMVAENRRLAAPASVDSLPTSAMQEDHVSMGWGAARKLRRSVANLGRIIACELVCAGRGLEFRQPLRACGRDRGGAGRPAGRRGGRGRARPLAGPRPGCGRGAGDLRRAGGRGRGRHRAPGLRRTTHGRTQTGAGRPGHRPVVPGWPQEAALRMLMNNLDPEVAERPDDLVVYGGTGRAARSWDAFDAICRTLTTLEGDETLLVQSGKPVGVMRTHEWAPRVLIANSNLVPDWATWDEFRRLEDLGLTMYGQMTAGSWIYIGTQGILQGTYECFAEIARRRFDGTLAGTITLTAGLGGMGGAQPLAVTMNDGVALCVEVDPHRIERRLETRYLDEVADAWRTPSPAAPGPGTSAGASRSAWPATPPWSCPSCSTSTSPPTSSPTRPAPTTRSATSPPT